MKFIRIGICALVVFGVASHRAVGDWARAAYLTQEPQLVVSPLLFPLVALFLIALGQWIFHRTASSYGTRMELQLLLADILLLFLAAQAFRTLGAWRRSVWFVV